MFSSMFNNSRFYEPTVQQCDRPDCYDCGYDQYARRPQMEHVGYDFWGNPVVREVRQRQPQPQRPRTSYQPRPQAQPQPRQRVERTPFGELFSDFDGDFFGQVGNSLFGSNFYNKNSQKKTAGKENVNPRFNHAKNSQCGGDHCEMDRENLPVPQRPAQEYTPAPESRFAQTAKKAQKVHQTRKAQKVQKAQQVPETEAKKSEPKLFKKEYASNFYSANGNSTTINRESVTENDKTATKVTKITEDRSGNQQTTTISPEKYDSEVKALFEDSDAIIQEIPTQIEAEEIPQIEQEKTFEEKIRESTIKNNSDDNKSHRSNNSADGLFGDIKF